MIFDIRIMKFNGGSWNLYEIAININIPNHL